MRLKPHEYFEVIKNANYTKSGDDVDWAIIVDDDRDKIILSFKESNSKRDWINNFNFPIKPYKNQSTCLLVTRGWAKAYKTCNDEVMENLIKQLSNTDKDYHIEIIGWSYGGALAILACEDLYFRTGIKANVITFGAPKVSFGRKTRNYIFTECCNSVHQYANVNDVVTYLPPFPFYKHIMRINVGDKFNLIKLCKPNIYHTIYGDKELY